MKLDTLRHLPSGEAIAGGRRKHEGADPLDRTGKEVLMSVLANPRFHNEDAARAWLESVQWPDGPVCSKCGEVGPAYKIVDTDTHRGRYRCVNQECRKDFSVTTGSVMERSHIALH
jgi:hypothetical protein